MNRNTQRTRKHQIPSTCLRRSACPPYKYFGRRGFAQAGQIPNKSQLPKSKQNLFGHWELELGTYLGFACLPVGREFVI